MTNSAPLEARPISDLPANEARVGTELAIEAQTDLGPLWLQRGAELVTPQILRRGTYEPRTSALMRRALGPGRTFVDVGANIGYFSVLASRLVGGPGRVFAVEPDPLNIRILEANLTQHGCTNTTVLPVAAWSERTTLKMRSVPAGGAATAVGVQTENGTSIPAVPLDEMIDGRVDFVKIDCEFTDHMVVRGARRLIDENPAMVIMVEFYAHYTSHTGHSAEQILDVYRQLGLDPYWIVKGHGLRPTTYAAVAWAGPPDKIRIFDFMLSRSMPEHLLARPGIRERLEHILPERYSSLVRRRHLIPRSPLEWAGDQLERVPDRWRPPIRRRDRQRRTG